MLSFIGRRLGYGFLVLLGVVLVVFFLFHALPGDPVAMMAGQRTDIATREAIQKELGLNRPLGEQLKLYMNDLSPIAIHDKGEEEQKKYNYISLFSVGDEEVLALKSPYLRRLPIKLSIC